MSPPDDTPPVARLARWSEWWFTPRWRALLTWIALTAIAGWVEQPGHSWFGDMTQQPINYLNRFVQAPLPPLFYGIASNLHSALLCIWFQPLALRLSLWRGLAWIGLPLVAQIPFILYYAGCFGFERLVLADAFESAALQYCILWGWRSRPWMCLPAQALALFWWKFAFGNHLINPRWLFGAELALINAALLLYGTRLLRPEERARA